MEKINIKDWDLYFNSFFFDKKRCLHKDNQFYILHRFIRVHKDIKYYNTM